MSRYVAYFRVSTARQGQSGLGLEAQQAAVRNFVGTEASIVASTPKSRAAARTAGPSCRRPSSGPSRPTRCCWWPSSTAWRATWQHLQRQGHTASLLEGLHYTFLEYAGANMAHYDFAELAFDGRITPDILAKIRALSVANRIILIADRDAGKQTRHDARARQQHAGFVYHVLPVREIENLLPPPVLVATLRGLYPKLGFDAAGLKQSAYTHAYLGKYLRARFPALPDSFAPTKGSGTLGRGTKRKFAEEAVKHVTWESMSPAARTLTQHLHQFILAHNPRLGSN